jgi:hypothetical protein
LNSFAAEILGPTHIDGSDIEFAGLRLRRGHEIGRCFVWGVGIHRQDKVEGADGRHRAGHVLDDEPLAKLRADLVGDDPGRYVGHATGAEGQHYLDRPVGLFLCRRGQRLRKKDCGRSRQNGLAGLCRFEYTSVPHQSFAGLRRTNTELLTSRRAGAIPAKERRSGAIGSAPFALVAAAMSIGYHIETTRP